MFEQKKTPIPGAQNAPASMSGRQRTQGTREEAPAGMSRANDEPKKLRIGDVQYNEQGMPLAEKPLAESDKTRLVELLAKLHKDDPKFYAAIENEDLVVTRGTLPANNIGRHHMSVSQQSVTTSALRWFLIDNSGVDLSKGDIDMESKEWKDAVALFQQQYPDLVKQDELAKTQVTRVIKGTFSSVIILDITQIEERERAYKEEYDKYIQSSHGVAPQLPQSVLATFRHEAGHLLFERTILFDNLGNPLPSTPLSGTLKEKVKEYSYDEDIKTDLELLSEYAAESVEEQHEGETFDIDGFKQENNPRFGVGGYHDLDGREQTPAGFGIRVARGLTLVAAQAMAREIRTIAQDVPVYLATVPIPKKEQRRFDVFMMMGPDRKIIRNDFADLKTRFPALSKYEGTVVAY